MIYPTLYAMFSIAVSPASAADFFFGLLALAAFALWGFFAFIFFAGVRFGFLATCFVALFALAFFFVLRAMTAPPNVDAAFLLLAARLLTREFLDLV